MNGTRRRIICEQGILVPAVNRRHGVADVGNTRRLSGNCEDVDALERFEHATQQAGPRTLGVDVGGCAHEQAGFDVELRLRLVVRWVMHVQAAAVRRDLSAVDRGLGAEDFIEATAAGRLGSWSQSAATRMKRGGRLATLIDVTHVSRVQARG